MIGNICNDLHSPRFIFKPWYGKSVTNGWMASLVGCAV